jgi:CHAT domain-containing protein
VSKYVPDGRLWVGDEATRDRVLDALDGARLFHFSGHGRLPGGAPWDHHLELAREQRLGLEDLLVAQPVVGVVVLSGCETGARGTLSRFSSVGLADGFLALGARTVVATDTRIKDEDALRIVTAFYEAGGLDRPAEALRTVVRAERKAGGFGGSAGRLRAEGESEQEGDLDAYRAFRVIGLR